jgi:hypothetical protein
MMTIVSALGLIPGFANMFQKHRDPAEEMQRNIQMLMQTFSPQKIGAQANSMYSVLQGSPMYQAGMGNLISGANQSQNLLTRNLAGAGIQGSGVGQIQRSMAPSVMGGQVANFNSGVYNQGLNSVMSLIGPMIEGGWRGGSRPENTGLMGLASGIQNTNWGPILDFFRRNVGGGNNNAVGGTKGVPMRTPSYGRRPV